jgi:hypothetical protein
METKSHHYPQHVNLAQQRNNYNKEAKIKQKKSINLKQFNFVFSNAYFSLLIFSFK